MYGKLRPSVGFPIVQPIRAAVGRAERIVTNHRAGHGAVYSGTLGTGSKTNCETESVQSSKMRNLVTFLGILLTLNLPAEAEVTKITEDNWRDILVGEWMVEL